MDSSEEEELFLLGFILLDDKRKKKQRNVDFGFARYFASVKDTDKRSGKHKSLSLEKLLTDFQSF